MLSYEYVIFLLFRWLDLFIIIALGGFIFVRWGLPYFKQEIADEQKNVQTLEDAIHGNLQEHIVLEKQLADNQTEAQLLKNQVIIWNAIVVKKQQKNSEQQQQRIAQLHKKYQEMATILEHERINKKIIQHAFNQAEQELRDIFHNQTTNSTFTESILHHMKKAMHGSR